VHVTPRNATDETAAQLGGCALSPDGPVVAGAFGTWTVTYTAGSLGIAPGGGIAVVPPFPGGGIRWRVGHVVAATTGRGGVSVRVRNVYPLKYHNAQFPIVFATVEGAPLRPGEQIHVTLGDPGTFIPGFYERARAQEHAMERATFQVAVDPLGNASYSNPAYPGGQPKGYRLVPGLPSVDVLPGPARRIGVVAPARVAPGEAFALRLRVEDEYGNVCTSFRGAVGLGTLPAGMAVEGPALVEFGSDAAGTATAGPFQIGAGRTGDASAAEPIEPIEPITFTAHAAEAALAGRSNPVEVVPAGTDRIYFGDLHAHAVAGSEGRREWDVPFASGGFGAYEPAYVYARDAAGLDFVAVAIFHHVGDDEEYRGLTRRFHEPGRFVPFTAVEVAAKGAGHRVVLFPGDDAPPIRGGMLEELWPALEGTGALAIPHHTNASSEGGPQNWEVQDWRRFEPRFQPAVEMSQTRGAFETDAPGGTTVIGGRGASVQDALARGCQVGFVGGTDNHYGQPGSQRCFKAGVDYHDHVVGGLTAVFAPELTRDAILRSLWQRRCYATTGARMVVEFAVDGHPMGTEFTCPAGSLAVSARVVGEAPIATVELIQDNRVVHTARGSHRVLQYRHTVTLGPGQTTFLYLRVTQDDGHVAWASPVWITASTASAD
jgi:hypothetical protein